MVDKVCPRCKEWKSISEFHKNKSREDGLSFYCANCMSKFAKNYYENNKKKISDYHYNYRIEHKDEFEKTLLKTRLKRCYNLTPEEWQQMFEQQQGCCAICGTHQSELDRRLDVHHLEIDGEIIVIALLCKMCNLGIGNFNHDVILLEKAIKFIKEKHP